jgi:hypothetical protein
MARRNHTNTRKRTRHHLAAVAVCCGILLTVLCVSSLRADYVITGNDGKVTRAGSYWIQGDKLFLQNGTGTINVYGIKSVAGENLSEDEIKKNDELMSKMRKDVDGLLSREKVIMDAQSADISKIIESASANTLDSGKKKAFMADLKENRGSLDQLKDTWKKVKLPDFSLVLVRDIKILQLLSLETSIDQTAKFVKTGDPTFREQAKAQLGMAKSFDEHFKAALPWK